MRMRVDNGPWHYTRTITFTYDGDADKFSDEFIVNSFRAIAALADHLGVDAGELAETLAQDNKLALVWEIATAGAGRPEMLALLLRSKE